jgi:hypothetical protein
MQAMQTDTPVPAPTQPVPQTTAPVADDLWKNVRYTRTAGADGRYVDEQQFDLASSMPQAIEAKDLTPTNIEAILGRLPVEFGQYLSWGNLSRISITEGVGFSPAFFEKHAAQIDWNLMSLYGYIPPEIARNPEYRRRLVPTMLMKNPNLRGEFLEAVADLLDFDHLVQNRQLSEEFVVKNLSVLDLSKLTSCQKLPGMFWIEHVIKPLVAKGDWHTLPRAAQSIVQSQRLGDDFVEALQRLQAEVAIRLSQNPVPGVPLPYRIVEGRTLLQYVKMGPDVLDRVLASTAGAPAEKRHEIRMYAAQFQNLTPDLIIRYYSEPSEMKNKDILGRLVEFQTLPPAYTEQIAEGLQWNVDLRQAYHNRQQLTTAQIYQALDGAIQDQRRRLATTLLLRVYRPKSDPVWLGVDPAVEERLRQEADWEAINHWSPGTTPNPTDVATQIWIHGAGRMNPLEFLGRHAFSEAQIREMGAAGVLGPLEWWILLHSASQRKPAVEWSPRFTEDFCTGANNRREWYRRVSIPVSGFEIDIRACFNDRVHDVPMSHVTDLFARILTTYIKVEIWQRTLRDAAHPLPLWFLHLLGKPAYSGLVSTALGKTDYWWNVATYQTGLTPEFIQAHRSEIDPNLIVRNQLARMNEPNIVGWLQEFEYFLDDDAKRFITENKTLAPIWHRIHA